MNLNDISRGLAAANRITRDANAITRGPSAIVKRIANKWIGRNIVRRLWFR